MPDDIFDEVLDGIGQDFEDNCAGLEPVTVNQVDPDSGAVLLDANNDPVTAADVPALKRVLRYGAVSLAGGEVGATASRFLMQLATVGFLPKPRDSIVESDGTVWLIDDSPESVQVIAHGQMIAVNCTRQRTNQ